MGTKTLIDCHKIILEGSFNCVRQNYISQIRVWVWRVLFACWTFYVQLEKFSLIWRSHYNWWRATNFDLYSTLMAIEQWGFFKVSHLLWHELTLYNGHVQEPVILTPTAEPLAVELSLPVLKTYVCPVRESNPDVLQARRMLYYCVFSVKIGSKLFKTSMEKR